MERTRRHSKHLSLKEKTFRLAFPALFALSFIGLSTIACNSDNKLNCQDKKPPFSKTGKCPSTPAFKDTAPVFYV